MQKLRGSPSSFQIYSVWKTTLILINGAHNSAWSVVKNIEVESTEANNLSLLL